MRMYLRWPTFKSWDREEGQHRLGDIVKVKTLLKPLSLFHYRSINVTVIEFQISTPKKENALHSFSESKFPLSLFQFLDYAWICGKNVVLQFFSLLHLIYL